MKQNQGHVMVVLYCYVIMYVFLHYLRKCDSAIVTLYICDPLCRNEAKVADHENLDF